MDVERRSQLERYHRNELDLVEVEELFRSIAFDREALDFLDSLHVSQGPEPAAPRSESPWRGTAWDGGAFDPHIDQTRRAIPQQAFDRHAASPTSLRSDWHGEPPQPVGRDRPKVLLRRVPPLSASESFWLLAVSFVCLMMVGLVLVVLFFEPAPPLP